MDKISSKQAHPPTTHTHTCIRYVSFEFLKGTCDAFAERAENTSARQLRDLLIACVSRSLCASFPAPDRSRRSLPARSTRCSTPWGHGGAEVSSGAAVAGFRFSKREPGGGQCA